MSKKTVLFISEAGPSVGLGHIVRSLALARSLQDHGITPLFFSPVIEQSVMGRVTSQGWNVVSETSQEFDAVIFDLERGAPSDDQLNMVPARKKIGFVGAGYKNIGYEKLDASFVQGLTSHPPSGNGKCFHGPEYVVLRPEFKQEPKLDRDPSIVFVCGGGSDPLDFTKLACDALEKCEKVRQVYVIIGSLYKGALPDCPDPGWKTWHIESPTFRRHVYCEVENPYSIMSKCGLALVSFGMTAYECMAAGLPTLTLSMSEDHLASANAIDELEGLISMGLITPHSGGGTVTIIHNVVNRALDGRTPLALKFLARNARKLVDGRGAERVAGKILEIL